MFNIILLLPYLMTLGALLAARDFDVLTKVMERTVGPLATRLIMCVVFLFSAFKFMEAIYQLLI